MLSMVQKNLNTVGFKKKKTAPPPPARGRPGGGVKRSGSAHGLTPEPGVKPWLAYKSKSLGPMFKNLTFLKN